MGLDEARSPGRLLQYGQDPRYYHVWLDAANEEDDEYYVVGVGEEFGRPRRRFLIDPNQGYLARKIELFYNERELPEGLQLGARAMVASIEEVLPCSDDRWFPKRTVTIARPDHPPPYKTRIMEVTQFDADNEPEDDLFYLDLPRGTSVSNPDDMRSALMMKVDKRIYSKDLQWLYDRGQAALADEKRSDNAATNYSLKTETAKGWFLGANVVLIVAVVAVIIFRRRYHAA